MPPHHVSSGRPPAATAVAPPFSARVRVFLRACPSSLGTWTWSGGLLKQATPSARRRGARPLPLRVNPEVRLSRPFARPGCKRNPVPGLRKAVRGSSILGSGPHRGSLPTPDTSVPALRRVISGSGESATPSESQEVGRSGPASSPPVLRLRPRALPTQFRELAHAMEPSVALWAGAADASAPLRPAALSPGSGSQVSAGPTLSAEAEQARRRASSVTPSRQQGRKPAASSHCPWVSGRGTSLLTPPPRPRVTEAPPRYR